ncbi:MAG: hypothetical protein IMY71_03375 [Bacteroidetes bacterium]|nr:hypothetical protein [Bacteroidota bacterium]
MKTKSNNYFIITMMIALLVSVSITGCQNSNSNSSTLEKKLDSALQESGSKLSDDQSFAEALNISSVVINISNLHIKEDSGNDDVILQGPYTKEISNGIVSFDQVDLFTGTYKKVDLTFQTSESTTFNGHSIIITGHYLTAGSSTIPFTLSSDFTKQIQLPLVNNGVTVSENSMVSISIIFDTNVWLSVLDFADANITNGEIAIDNNNNTFLLNAFEANLSSH